MKKLLTKYIACLLSLLMTFLGFAGCGQNTKEAESVVQAYFTAVFALNLDAMEVCLSEGTNKDMGVDTSFFERDYAQSDIYKKSVESMFKTLSNTILYTIDGSVAKEDGKAAVSVTVSHTDVNKTAVDEVIQTKINEYVQQHPEVLEKTEADQNDINIQLMANAYNKFVKLQPKVSKTFDVILQKIDGQWKILNGPENKELKALFQEIYETY